MRATINTTVDIENIDMAATPNMQVEIQRDITGGYKLYVHQEGRCVVRIGKLALSQILLPQGEDLSRFPTT